MKKMLCIAVACFFVFTQDEFIQFETVSVQNDLSDAFVNDVVQGKEGFLWIGTSDGLNRYDGFKMKVYRDQGLGENELSQNNIRVLAIDNRGYIWIGENNGIDILNPYTETFTNYRFNKAVKNSISSNHITAIFKDSNGSMWIGTDKGLNHFNYKTQSFRSYEYSALDTTSISNNVITYIHLDKRRRLWIGTENGLNLFNRKANKFRRFHISPIANIEHPVITCITEIDEKTFLLGTSNEARDENNIFTFDTKTGKLKHDNDIGIIKKFFSAGLKATKHIGTNYLWFSTYASDGLHLYDIEQNTIRTFSQNDPDISRLANNDIRRIITDKSGLIWVATAGAGLSKIRYARNRHFLLMKRNRRQRNTLSNNQITAIYEDSNDDVWYGTINGLNRYTPRRKRMRVYYPNPNQNSLSNSNVTAINEDNLGGFWIGTLNGLNKLDRKRHRFTSYLTNNSRIAGNNITSIISGKNSIIWVGTDKGLSRISVVTNAYTNFLHREKNDNSLVNNDVLALAIEESGLIWIGTKNGLSKFNPYRKRFYNYFYDRKDLKSISHNTILSIIIDDNKTVWIGTQNGLNRYNRASNNFTRYSTRDGLPNSTIHGMVKTNNKRNKTMWISTNKGLSRFKYEESKFKNYNLSDGLPSNEFNQSAYFGGFSGKIYFGTSNGAVEFFPERLLVNRYEPNLLFTDFKVNFKNFNINPGYNKITELHLNYNQLSISFNLVPIEYTASSKNSFLYMMEGINTEWINAGSRRFISFPLQPATYLFKAKAINSDGLVSTKVKKLLIIVHPPFWKAGWFVFLLISMGLGLFFLLFYLRHRAQKIREQLLEKEVFQRTKELRDKSIEIEKEIVIRRETENALRSARKETDSILENVNQGLFLLSADCKISNQYSSELENIFQKKNLAKIKFIDLVKPLVTDKVINELNDFIGLLFNSDIDNYALQELNPLDQVQLHFEGNDGKFRTKHLEFLFLRVLDNETIISLLVTARDITEIIDLQEQLKTTQDKNKMEMEQLLSILRANPGQLRDYLKTIDEELLLISRLFKEDEGSYRSVLSKTFRIIHNLKGNAGLLDLEFYVVKFHEIEEIMSRVLDKPKITGDDFLPIIFEIDEINSYQGGMNDLIDRVIAMSTQLQKTFNDAKDIHAIFETNLSNIVEKLSINLNKDAKLEISLPDDYTLSFEQQKLIRDVTTQLIRNSLIHGIEDANERKKNGKLAQANLSISIKKVDSRIFCSYRDDGRGLDIDKIRNKAVKTGFISIEDAYSMTSSDIADLIFRDGLTTLETTSKDAGRGEGMSMMKQMIEKWDGRVKFSFSKGLYFEFSFDFLAK